MKDVLSKQTEFDDIDRINKLESELNLSSERIIDRIHGKVKLEQKRRRKRRIVSLSMAACITLIVGVNWHAIYTFASELFSNNTVQTEDKLLTDVNMNLIHITKPDSFDEEAVYLNTKFYSSLKECTDAIDISVLTSNLAWDKNYNKKVRLLYPTDEWNYACIEDDLYIIGDLKDFRLDENGGSSCYYKTSTENEKYKSPIRLKLEFFISGKPKQSPGIDNHYIDSEFAETYTTPNGIEATIIQGREEEAYFYHDNIKYSLTGNVEISELKRIIDSFSPEGNVSEEK